MKLFIVATLFVATAQAEYRAFKLEITNSLTGAVRTVISNLDPDQYRGYHPLDPNETIKYTDTWMCKGNTSGEKAICSKPGEKRAQGPDSNDKKP